MKLDGWKKAYVVLLLAASAIASHAQTFTDLVNFNFFDGDTPQSTLVQGTDGNFYGTTYAGGSGVGSVCSGCGTVFKVTPAGVLTTLYSFCSQPLCTDGALPYAGLVLATDGNFYGTTLVGGNPSCATNAAGCGTVFKMTPGGTLTTLYSFCTQPGCSDGSLPQAGLVQGSDGNFYGTTGNGGASTGFGTVFEITPTGTLTTMYRFCVKGDPCLDGGLPQSGLVEATDGSFYGTTFYGGAGKEGLGTVFRITRAGALRTVHSFSLEAGTGRLPVSGLVLAADGNFYGTLFEGGIPLCDSDFGCGTVYKMTPKGEVTTLYSFCAQTGCIDGARPVTGVIQATDGNLYGVTTLGGSNGGGTIFEITPGGSLTTLHSFCGQPACTDGTTPYEALLQSTSGIFYSTTLSGGATGDFGTIFSLSTGLGRFVSLVRDSGKVGQIGAVLGQGFTGTTGVSLNGTPANFTVVSDGYIRATVPAGAATGLVTVNTPSGTLTSNVIFHVEP